MSSFQLLLLFCTDEVAREILPLDSVLFLLCGLTGCSKSEPPAAVKKIEPNILLITVDTLRADHLAPYGYSKKTGRVFERLAQEGILFENAIAPRGSTWPSLTSILTSLHPKDHGVRENGELLDAGIKTIPEYLKRHGYATGRVSREHDQSAKSWFRFENPCHAR